MNNVKLTGTKRTSHGKKSTKDLRKAGNVPCVMYGGEETISFAVEARDLKNIVYTDKFVVAQIDIDGTVKNAILKDLDTHPVTDALLHVDFQELVPGKKVKVEIPVKTTGFAAGVKEGGKLELNLRTLSVKATPEELVTDVPVDITSLELGKSLKVRDLETNLEIMNPAGIPIARIIVPRAMRSAASKADGDDAPATEEAAAE